MADKPTHASLHITHAYGPPLPIPIRDPIPGATDVLLPAQMFALTYGQGGDLHHHRGGVEPLRYYPVPRCVAESLSVCALAYTPLSGAWATPRTRSRSTPARSSSGSRSCSRGATLRLTGCTATVRLAVMGSGTGPGSASNRASNLSLRRRTGRCSLTRPRGAERC